MKTIFEKMVISHLILFIVVYVILVRIPLGSGIVYAVYPEMEMNASPNPVGSGARALGIGGAFISMHIGFLFRSGYHKIKGKNMRFRIGGVIKTPFDAEIRHEKQDFLFIDYPEDPVNNQYFELPPTFRDLTLRMPLSYGLGISWDFSQYFSVACDIYRTHWESYILKYPTGEEKSPIDMGSKEESDIKTTTQARLGAEYIIENTKRTPYEWASFMILNRQAASLMIFTE